jgi:hypothetical protein
MRVVVHHRNQADQCRGEGETAGHERQARPGAVDQAAQRGRHGREAYHVARRCCTAAGEGSGGALHKEKDRKPGNADG